MTSVDRGADPVYFGWRGDRPPGTGDWERGASTPPSVAVVEAVSKVTGREPTELPPIAEVLDTDALDSLQTRSAAEGTSPVNVSFTYASCFVQVYSSGEILVVEEDSAPEPDSETASAVDEFQAGLDGLLADAFEDGLSVEGGWVCRNGDGMPDYDIEISEITKTGDR